MADFTITAVDQNVREYEDKYGPKKAYNLKLEGPNGPASAQLSQKPTTAPPTVGQTLSGHIEQTEYGPRFRKDKPQGGFGGQGGGGFKKDPVTEARITRMHAQKVAIQYASMKAQLGQLPESFRPADLKPIIDWFVEDANTAKPPAAPKPVRDFDRPGGTDIPVDMPPVPARDTSTVLNG